MSFSVESDGYFDLSELAEFATEHKLPWAACVSHPHRRPRRLAQYGLFQYFDPSDHPEMDLTSARHHGYRYFLRVPKLQVKVPTRHHKSLRTESIALDIILRDFTVLACFMHPPGVASGWLRDLQRLRDHPRLIQQPDVSPSFLHILKFNRWLITLPSRSSNLHYLVQCLDSQGRLPKEIDWRHRSALMSIL